MKSWQQEHPDVVTLMSLDPETHKFEFSVKDLNTGVQRVRHYDMSALPLSIGELELEDFINNVFEMLYREVEHEKGVQDKKRGS